MTKRFKAVTRTGSRCHKKFKTRADLKKTAAHNDLWQEINQENVERIIPESMFLCLSLHFESIDILEG